MSEDNKQILQNDQVDADGCAGSTSGVIVGRNQDKPVRVNGDGPFITFAYRRANLEEKDITPNLLTHKGSMFVIVPNFDAVAATREYRECVLGQKIYVIDPLYEGKNRTCRSSYLSDCYNPIDALVAQNPVHLDLKSGILAKMIVGAYFEGKERPPFFTSVAETLLQDALRFVATAPELSNNQRNLRYLTDLVEGVVSLPEVKEGGDFQGYVTTGNQKTSTGNKILFEDYTPNVAETVSFIKSNSGLIKRRWKKLVERLTDENGVYSKISSCNKLLLDNQRTIQSVLSSCLHFAQKNACLLNTTVDFERLNNGNTTIYFVLPPCALRDMGVWPKLVIEAAMDACRIKDPIDPLRIDSDKRTLFMLENFSEYGALSCVKYGLNQLRDKGISLWVGMHLSSANNVYGKETMDAFIAAASCVDVSQVAYGGHEGVFVGNYCASIPGFVSKYEPKAGVWGDVANGLLTQMKIDGIEPSHIIREKNHHAILMKNGDFYEVGRSSPSLPQTYAVNTYRGVSSPKL